MRSAISSKGREKQRIKVVNPRKSGMGCIVLVEKGVLGPGWHCWIWQELVSDKWGKAGQQLPQAPPSHSGQSVLLAIVLLKACGLELVQSEDICRPAFR